MHFGTGSWIGGLRSGWMIALFASGALAASAVVPVHAEQADELENHVLVTGDVGFGFTRQTVDCYVSDGKLMAAQIPGSGAVKLPPPDLSVGRLSGPWDVEIHTPAGARFFVNKKASRVVVVKPKLDPLSWKIKLHGVRMAEWPVMRGKIAHAYVSTVLHCTSIIELPPRQ